MGTGRAAGRHSSTMRRAIGARTPSGEVARLSAVHQYYSRGTTGPSIRNAGICHGALGPLLPRIGKGACAPLALTRPSLPSDDGPP